MKPGDLIRLVHGDKERNDLTAKGTPMYLCEGRPGVIIRPVTLDDRADIRRWCDWWVLMDGELQVWAKENLEVINETG